MKNNNEIKIKQTFIITSKKCIYQDELLGMIEDADASKGVYDVTLIKEEVEDED